MPAVAATRQASSRVIYVATLILAACSLLYELLIAQALATLASNTVVWYSVTIGLYLAAMGIGALLHDRHATDDPWPRLLRIELLLSAAGAAAIPILYFAHTVATLLDLEGLSTASNFLFFGTAFLMTTIIGVLSGFELPVLIDLGNTASNRQRVTNRVLASDYMGSLLGGLAFPMILLPLLSLLHIGLLTATVNFAIALVALNWFLPVSRRPVRQRLICGFMSIFLVLGLTFARPIDGYFVKNYYFYFEHSDDLPTLFGSMEHVDDVYRERSYYQRIDLVYDEAGFDTDSLIDVYSSKFTDNPSQPKNYALFLNGDFQLVSSYEEFFHEYFAHVPIITNGAVPRRVLVMGAGDGQLIRELVKYPEIESILHVDLDARLVGLAKEHPIFLAMNEHALDDPRVETVFDDAFRYIRNSTASFDAIFLDFPNVEDYNLSKLFSREFYHFVRKRVAPGGFIALDAPGIENRSSSREIYTSTLSAAGFQFVKPYASRIEKYNSDAAAILQRQGERSADIREILADHADSLEFGFVIARDNIPDLPLYRDPRIKRHVLTDKRLQLTFEHAVGMSFEFNEDAVNSIFLPTLPDGGVWGIRTAW